MRLAPIILLIVLLLASCAKDDTLAPCQHGDDATQSQTKGTGSYNKDGAVDPEGPGSGSISDDGDDIMCTCIGHSCARSILGSSDLTTLFKVGAVQRSLMIARLFC